MKRSDNDVSQRISALPTYPDYTIGKHIPWTRFCVAADWHLPFVHKELFKRLIIKCREKSIKHILIAGDFFDMNAISKFFSVHQKVPWEQEKEVAARVLDVLQQSFREIYFICANHELRYIKYLINPAAGNPKDPYELVRFYKPDNIITDDHIVIDNWYICHPDQARKVPLSLARDLSDIHIGKNIIVTHGHQQCLGRNKSDTQWICDLGCMLDKSRIEYKNTRSAKPYYQWQNGFAIIDGETIDLQWW